MLLTKQTHICDYTIKVLGNGLNLINEKNCKVTWRKAWMHREMKNLGYAYNQIPAPAQFLMLRGLIQTHVNHLINATTLCN